MSTLVYSQQAQHQQRPAFPLAHPHLFYTLPQHHTTRTSPPVPPHRRASVPNTASSVSAGASMMGAQTSSAMTTPHNTNTTSAQQQLDNRKAAGIAASLTMTTSSSSSLSSTSIHLPSIAKSSSCPSSRSSSPLRASLTSTVSSLSPTSASLLSTTSNSSLPPRTSQALSSTTSSSSSSSGPVRKHTRSFSFSASSINIAQATSSDNSTSTIVPTTASSGLTINAASIEKQLKQSCLSASIFGTFALPAGSIAALADCATLVSYRRGDFLFRSGDAAECLYVLSSAGANVAIDPSSLLSPGGGLSPISMLARRIDRGSQSPPIASSGFAAARSRVLQTTTNPSARRMTHPLGASVPVPLSVIREYPVRPLVVRSHRASFDNIPPIRPEEDKEIEELVKDMYDDGSNDEEVEKANSATAGKQVAASASVSPLSTSPTRGSNSPPSPTSAIIRRVTHDVLGVEGLLPLASSTASTPKESFRTYTARVESESIEVLVVSYRDMREKVFSQWSLTVDQLESTLKSMISRELSGLPIKPIVPTLASIISAQQEKELAAAAAAAASQQSAIDSAASSNTTATPPARHHRSLSSISCKYTDIDLLQHPLFQKVFYVYCQQESTHELLEFWRDCLNYRSGFNKAQLSMEEEAKILYKAYIFTQAKKHQKQLSTKVMEGIKEQMKDVLATNPSSTATIPSSRFLYVDAERETESLLISGSLRGFKQTQAFAKILPFVKLDPKMRLRKEEERKKVSAATASNASSTEAKPTQGQSASASPPAVTSPVAKPLEQQLLQRSNSCPESQAADEMVVDMKKPSVSTSESYGIKTPTLGDRSTPSSDAAMPLPPLPYQSKPNYYVGSERKDATIAAASSSSPVSLPTAPDFDFKEQ